LASLVQGTNGDLYGTTSDGGGANLGGTVFKITPSGVLTSLYSFCPQTSCADGYLPYAPLIQGTNGNFYGTTYGGGANNLGTVFKITPSGMLTTLHGFAGFPSDGQTPVAGLVQATNGNFYGTAAFGGGGSKGTVFKITPSGTLTTLHSFGGPDGDSPYASVVQALNGNFYGTTFDGGTTNAGTVFKMTPGGRLTTLHSFDGTDGDFLQGPLIQWTDGNFYGTTSGGGANQDGTVFKITPSGTLTTLYSFCAQTNCADGATPGAGLVQATDGNLYGTTYDGGNGGGTVFQITPNGALTTLYSFCAILPGCKDGAHPSAGLVQDTNGTFYGTTQSGGTSADGYGTVFSLSVGLGPFVETQTTSGMVGGAVKILGTSLTGSTSVTFNGTTATFTVKSKSEIATTVPTGATTGTVQVVTPGGTLSSNVPFTVKP
jgi:uncharacterized repeat protein (TIGR03803 family)